MQASSHPAYRPDIDGMRALAVIAVLLFHAFPASLRGGFIGVDVFFVISGYLISGILLGDFEQGKFDLIGFYRRRIRRIFPALVVVLAACLGFGWVALLGDEYRQLGKHMAGGAGFISNLLLWQESGYFDRVAETKPLLHLWSLGVEEQFYLLWPPLMWMAYRCRLAVWKLAGMLALLSFALACYEGQHDAVTAFYAPQSRLWELLFGALLACRAGWISEKRMPGLSWLGIALLVVGLVCITPDRASLSAWMLLPVLAAVGLIAAGPQGWINRRVLAQRVLVQIGLISFPLYLWHWPIFSFLRIISSRSVLPPLWAWGAVVASFILAWLTYRFIEMPVRANGRLRTVWLVVFMLALGSAGYGIYATDGLPERAGVRGLQNNGDALQRMEKVNQGCLDYLQVKAPPFSYCRFTPAGGRETVAVIGDSHAQAAYPGIAELLKARGVNSLLLANSNCPPFPGSDGDAVARKTECRARINAMLGAVIAQKDIRKVFLFSRGARYLTGTGFGEAEKDEHPPVIVPPLFAQSLQRAVDQLRAAGKKVYYVAENPETGIFPVRCIARPFHPQTSPCTVARAVVEQRQAEYLALLRQLHHVVVIETIPAFCASGQCPMLDHGRLLYADDDHLSVVGSRLQAKFLEPYLQ